MEVLSLVNCDQFSEKHIEIPFVAHRHSEFLVIQCLALGFVGEREFVVVKSAAITKPQMLRDQYVSRKRLRAATTLQNT
jgi:hypothetical protein